MRDFKPWLVLAIFIPILIIFVFTTSDSVGWMDLNKAVERAKGHKRVIMVFITSTECLECEKVLEILREEEIAKLIQEKFLPVKINYDSESDYAELQKFLLTPRKFEAPSLIFLTPEGELVEMKRVSADREEIKDILQEVSLEECPCF